MLGAFFRSQTSFLRKEGAREAGEVGFEVRSEEKLSQKLKCAPTTDYRFLFLYR